jgi:hypothetical protein
MRDLWRIASERADPFLPPAIGLAASIVEADESSAARFRPLFANDSSAGGLHARIIKRGPRVLGNLGNNCCVPRR